jgi:hypothetical protein
MRARFFAVTDSPLFDARSIVAPPNHGTISVSVSAPFSTSAHARSYSSSMAASETVPPMATTC